MSTLPPSDDDNVADCGEDDSDTHEKLILSPLRRRLSNEPTSCCNPMPSKPSSPCTSTIDDGNCKENDYNQSNQNISNEIDGITIQPSPLIRESRTDPSNLSIVENENGNNHIALKTPPNIQGMRLKSCLSMPSSKKRVRSPSTVSTITNANSEQYETPPSSPIVEPSRKKQKQFGAEDIHDPSEASILLITRKAVQFAPSSAMVYEADVPVNQSLTPVPMETAKQRYPTEMKALTEEEYNSLQITKQNHAILRAVDMMYYSNNIEMRKNEQRRRKKSRRTSFYIHCTSSDYDNGNTTDKLLHTI